MTAVPEMELDTDALLDAVDGAAGIDAPERRIENALSEAFAFEGLLGWRRAVATARRFVLAVSLVERGLSDEAIAGELGCSATTVRQDREDVERLASGSHLLRERLLDGGDQK